MKIIVLPNLSAINTYTLSIRQQGDLACQHCQKQGQWRPHGFLYKSSLDGSYRKTGKRIICERRRGGQGCGRTLKVMVQAETHQLHVVVANIAKFIMGLVMGLSLHIAYEQVTGTRESRNAWRWWTRLKGMEGALREHCFELMGRVLPLTERSTKPKRSLMPVLSSWLQLQPKVCPCAELQCYKKLAMLQNSTSA